MSTAVANTQRSVTARPWTLGWLLEALLTVIAAAILGLLLSILLEWLGMALWWPEQGAQHSARLLEQELALLNNNFRTAVLGTSPVLIAEQAAAWVFQYSGLAWLIQWLTVPLAADAHPLQITAQHYSSPLLEYLLAAATISQVYGVRIAVALLSLPVFLLFGLVGLVDGLVQRDLRRFGGGIESGFIYHHLKPIIKPLFWLPILIYLACPVSLHPNAVFLPPAVLFALLVAKTVSRFKKYL